MERVERLFLVLNEDGRAVAKGALQSPLDAEVLQFRIVQQRGNAIDELETVQMMGCDEGAPDFMGVIERRKFDSIVVRPTAPLDQKARKNLRIETSFNSLIYPVTGSWKGQRVVRGKDLSCGGVAFYSAQPLEVDEIVELVLPMTDQPLLLKVQVLRRIESQSPLPLYAARFVELIHDEEALVRKAVFEIQMESAR